MFVKPWKTLARDGALVLQERDGEYVIRTAGVGELMSSRRHRSEDAMAAYAAGCKRVLIGGLGLGFTLRAVLEKSSAAVVVAELSPAVVEWNRTLLGLEALNDPRVTVHVGDVAEAEGRFDAILLDTDNGPSGLSDPRNAKLYGPNGVARFRQMLKPRGLLVVWLARSEPAFAKTLGRGGFDVTEQTLAGHTLFVARGRSS